MATARNHPTEQPPAMTGSALAGSASTPSRQSALSPIAAALSTSTVRRNNPYATSFDASRSQIAAAPASPSGAASAPAVSPEYIAVRQRAQEALSAASAAAFDALQSDGEDDEDIATTHPATEVAKMRSPSAAQPNDKNRPLSGVAPFAQHCAATALPPPLPQASKHAPHHQYYSPPHHPLNGGFPEVKHPSHHPMPAPFDGPHGSSASYAKGRADHHQAPPPPSTVTGLSFNSRGMAGVLAGMGGPADVAAPGGAVLTVYNGDISQHFTVASEATRITSGLIKYAEHHERFGGQTRFRFQLCNNYLHGKCQRLSDCSYIHAMSLPRPTEVHLNPYVPRKRGTAGAVLSPQDDPAVADSYETLPAGFVVPVYAPNDLGSLQPQLIPSQMIILTAGAVTARRWTSESSGGSVGGATGGKARHCAHFQFKRLCHLGSQCHFVHSKVPFQQHLGIDQQQPSSVMTRSTDSSHDSTRPHHQ